MDPFEEQAAELEVLEAIYDQDFRIVEPATSTAGARFEIIINDDAGAGIKLRLSFIHTLEYPEQQLILVVHALEGLSSPSRKKLQSYLEAVASENLQMPCVHTLCDAAREWLVDNVVGQANTPDTDQDHTKFETLDSTQTEKVEVISSKAIGTPVTVESFAEWRESFMEEIQRLKSKEQLDKESKKKMTGRQLFESRTIVVSAESESFWEAEASQALQDETT